MSGQTSGAGSEPGFEHEQVTMVRGVRSAVAIIVAVHSTALGPAIGGCRLRRYVDWRDGLDDALALSAAMTEKSSLAGLDHGGGKTVAVLPPGPLDPATRAALVLDIADVIGSLQGRYLTGPDLGTGPRDMQIIHQRTGYALCRPISGGGSGDSGEATAQGVLAALLAGAEHVFGSRRLLGRRIGILGLGNVGLHLAGLLNERGATLTVADIDEKRRAAAQALGAHWSDPRAILSAELDILVPAAVGKVLTRAVAEDLNCPLVVGPANNQLAHDDVADILARRGIVWVPDFLASAGGILHAVHAELHGLAGDQLASRVAAIGDTVTHVLTDAARSGVTAQQIANDRAHDRIRHADDQGAAAEHARPAGSPAPAAQRRAGARASC